MSDAASIKNTFKTYIITEIRIYEYMYHSKYIRVKLMSFINIYTIFI